MKQYNKILEAINRGIQFALDDFEPEDIELSKPKQETITKEDSLWKNIITQEGFVDLGLPSKTLWCKYNLGVDPNKLFDDGLCQYWYGGYYQWGETEPYYNPTTDGIVFNKGNKKFLQTKDKYCYNYDTGKRGFDELQPEDDPASIYYKSTNYHVPTSTQFEELENNTTKKFITNYNNVVGLNGLLLTAKNGNEIFFPSNGFIDDDCQHYLREAVYCWAKNKYFNVSQWYDKKGKLHVTDNGITGDEYGSYAFSYHNTNSQYDYISISGMVQTHATAIRPVYNFK